MSEQPQVNPAIGTPFGALKQIDAGLLSVGYADAIALMDALGIPDAIIAGFDWGARTGGIQPRKDRHERTLAHGRRTAHGLGPAAR